MKDARGHGSDPTGYAKAEQTAMRRGIDERHFPTRTPQDLAAAQVLGQGHPKSTPVPLGQSFQAAKDALARGRTVALPAGAENRRLAIRERAMAAAGKPGLWRKR
jgi:hypothetical protein